MPKIDNVTLTHTPGPLHGGWTLRGQTPLYRRASGELAPGNAPVVCQVINTDLTMQKGTAQGNSRLLAAAYTSYDKHCGANAIEAAEDDLLGEALEALRNTRQYVEAARNDCPRPLRDAVQYELDAIDSILAKVREEK